MLKKFLVIATLAAGLISTQVSAAFVSTDWKNSGDEKAVLDTVTGIEWLRVQETRNQSFGTTLSLLDTKYAGWRIPTYDEMVVMMARFYAPFNIDIYTPYAEVRSGGYLYAAQAFTRWFGNGSISGHHNVGMYIGPDGQLARAGSYSNGYGSYAIFYGMTANVDLDPDTVYNIDKNWGTFLVSDGGTTLSSINDPTLNINNPNAPINMADVSAPAGLAAAGLLMLFFGARRKAA